MKTTKKLIAIRIRPTTETKLKEIAEEKEMNTSELVRTILENYISTR